MILSNLEGHYDPEILDTAQAWADQIRPGLESSDETIANPQLRADEISPLDKLEVRLASFGITEPIGVAELALVGLQLSRQAEMEKK